MYERVCKHCGAIYLATALDEAVMDYPLCCGCLCTLGDDAGRYLGVRPVSESPVIAVSDFDEL